MKEQTARSSAKLKASNTCDRPLESGELYIKASGSGHAAADKAYAKAAADMEVPSRVELYLHEIRER